jgi:hypothetical protein
MPCPSDNVIGTPNAKMIDLVFRRVFTADMRYEPHDKPELVAAVVDATAVSRERSLRVKSPDAERCASRNFNGLATGRSNWGRFPGECIQGGAATRSASGGIVEPLAFSPRRSPR